MSHARAISPAGKATAVDSFGLWTQTVAVLVAILTGALATRTNLRHRRSVTT